MSFNGGTISKRISKSVNTVNSLNDTSTIIFNDEIGLASSTRYDGLCKLSSQAGEDQKDETKQRKIMNLVDPAYELIDPTPNIHELFVLFSDQLFFGALGACTVEWSKRMTSCAGVCSYHSKSGFCSIRLSEPLLKLRPRKDLIETLLHEMIHAYLFVTQRDRDRDGHGPNFQTHMHRINATAGTKITIYHSFHAEVALYKQHWWRCVGNCREKAPFYGWVKRAMNRAPGPADIWWSQHVAMCGGTFIKIKEPDNFLVKAVMRGEKKKGEKDKKTYEKEDKKKKQRKRIWETTLAKALFSRELAAPLLRIKSQKINDLSSSEQEEVLNATSKTKKLPSNLATNRNNQLKIDMLFSGKGYTVGHACTSASSRSPNSTIAKESTNEKSPPKIETPLLARKDQSNFEEVIFLDDDLTTFVPKKPAIVEEVLWID